MSTKSTTNSDPTKQLTEDLVGIVGSERYSFHGVVGNYLVNGFGGPAEHLVVAKDNGEIVSIAKNCLARHKPYILVAAGTGSLFSEIGFPGVVIINRTSTISFSPTHSEALVDGGVSTREFVHAAASRSLGGLEFLGAIPGTIGGAVATNASWGDHHLTSYLKEAVLFIPKGDLGEVVTVPGDELARGKTNRLFEEPKNSPIILSARLKLAEISQDEILRRINSINQRAVPVQQAASSLGWVFRPSLQSTELPTAELSALRLPKDISVNWRRNPDLVIYKQGRVLPSQLRLAVRQIATTLREKGVVLDERIAFLGYWPSGEQYGNQTNTESF